MVLIILSVSQQLKEKRYKQLKTCINIRDHNSKAGKFSVKVTINPSTQLLTFTANLIKISDHTGRLGEGEVGGCLHKVAPGCTLED